jgi:hypothetical protein
MAAMVLCETMKADMRDLLKDESPPVSRTG